MANWYCVLDMPWLGPVGVVGAEMCTADDGIATLNEICEPVAPTEEICRPPEPPPDKNDDGEVESEREVFPEAELYAAEIIVPFVKSVPFGR